MYDRNWDWKKEIEWGTKSVHGVQWPKHQKEQKNHLATCTSGLLCWNSWFLGRAAGLVPSEKPPISLARRKALRAESWWFVGISWCTGLTMNTVVVPTWTLKPQSFVSAHGGIGKSLHFFPVNRGQSAFFFFPWVLTKVEEQKYFQNWISFSCCLLQHCKI